jgi:phenylpropionate dioxygenase-like ring-hydroxylating dioxygenase large terminal subunit
MTASYMKYPVTPNPDGWYAVALSDDIRPGQVEPIACLGQDLVLFRTESGEARVLDAYCVHMGAHLGHGGRVEGDCIVCPFHAWKYASDGRCVDIPYAKQVPKRAAVKPWPVMERNGVILVWNHHLGKDPFYEIPQFEDEGWTEPRWTHLELEMHILDIAENGVDIAHFPVVHRCNRGAATLHDREGMPFRFQLLTSYPGDGIGIVGAHVNVATEWSYWGPGMFHSISLAEDFGMRVRQLFHFTPEPEGKIHFRIGISADESTIPEDAREFVLEQNAKIAVDNLLEDAPIWKHKRFWRRPTLSDGDGPVAPLRAWLRQFFPELSSDADELPSSPRSYAP